MEKPIFVDLFASADRQRAARNVACNRRARGDYDVVGYPHGRYKLRVRADKDVFADYRFVFFLAVVVARNRAAADIAALIDLAIPKIA